MKNNKHLPDWEDAPEWANWRAIEKGGELCYYEKKPVIYGSYRWETDGFYSYSGEFFNADNWWESLERRPENTAPIPDELTQMCGPNYELWEYLHDELSVIALDSQIGDIIEIVRRIEQKRKEQQ